VIASKLVDWDRVFGIVRASKTRMGKVREQNLL
jgi:hypothetical protein